MKRDNAGELQATDARNEPDRAGSSNPRLIDFLLVGGGLASATAAETLRIEGAEGSIVIVSAEDRLPYHRPALSARLRMSESVPEPPPVLKEEDYRARDIEVLRGVRAVAVDPGRHLVRTDKAGTLAYRKLLIATGAAPIRLQLPGSDLNGIHYLRTAEDARSIHEAARAARRCVVIGASFIGMEMSSALRQRGLDVQLVAGAAGIFGPLDDEEISSFFAGLLADKGVDVLRIDAAAFEGIGSVEAVVLQDGRRLPCDFVVAGVGVHPDIDFLEGSGIELGDGIVVDERLQASVPDVYAAGDVASFFDPVFKLRRRVEHWDNAVKQGRLVARNMLGHRRRYDEVSGFFCHVFDVSFQFAGIVKGARQHRSLGSAQQLSWARIYLDEWVPRALFTLGRPARETATIQSLIRYRTNIQRYESEIDKDGFFLTDIPTQAVLVLQGGGAMGAFECGVVRALEESEVYPDIVAGVSIGAFNGAIVASHPRHAAEALESFWHELGIASPEPGNEQARKLWSSMFVLMFGVPNFFAPRWSPWTMSPENMFREWTSFYDHAPARRLLDQYVDFKALKSSPVRLLVSAVNVETGQLEVFDSYVDEITVDHLLASGSLPPGLPWTPIGQQHYWDGGIISNSPLDQVVERCGAAGKRVVVVDLFSNSRPLPTNIFEVMSRRDEIVYAERIRRAGAEQELLHDAKQLVEAMLSMLQPGIAARVRELPPYVQLMGAPQAPSITRIVREASVFEPAGRDFDFSRQSIDQLMQAGLQAGRRAMRSPQKQRPSATVAEALSSAVTLPPGHGNQDDAAKEQPGPGPQVSDAARLSQGMQK
ncbi:MAG TPA: FAD-dependent oxidoreductase [Burkholderiaceae bacterium]|nr:FAD-dependent oxidoreductase [Burkholderiaceae bacterium]